MEIDRYRKRPLPRHGALEAGQRARDPTPEDVHAVLAERLNERLGLHEVLELDVTRVPVST